MSATEQTTEGPLTTARPNFAATRWSVVLAARQTEASAQSREALETLCRGYWQPLYAFVRRQGHSPQDAQDLTQEFFALLLDKQFLNAVDRHKGKFRSFLLAALKHFLANEWDKMRAQKRGGGKTAVSIDAAAAETSCAQALATHESADRLYDRRWALTLLERTMARLEREHQSKARAFELLRPTLVGDRNSIPYTQIARELDSTEGAVKVAVHRLRQRYREILREEIGDTVASKSEVEEELRYLFSALG
jgi:RNA polymerase sigma-70 factor (ECF subfamily)